MRKLNKKQRKALRNFNKMPPAGKRKEHGHRIAVRIERHEYGK
jgi:hypothetical protein